MSIFGQANIALMWLAKKGSIFIFVWNARALAKKTEIF